MGNFLEKLPSAVANPVASHGCSWTRGFVHSRSSLSRARVSQARSDDGLRSKSCVGRAYSGLTVKTGSDQTLARLFLNIK